MLMEIYDNNRIENGIEVEGYNKLCVVYQIYLIDGEGGHISKLNNDKYDV